LQIRFQAHSLLGDSSRVACYLAIGTLWMG